mmetsp:Transcript_18041/g.42508  ORF Transcript_18041/g.42508 Transcript_18041/m.42508 type:complete len:234 (-) Transcript_18041:1884-2585(-)
MGAVSCCFWMQLAIAASTRAAGGTPSNSRTDKMASLRSGLRRYSVSKLRTRRLVVGFISTSSTISSSGSSSGSSSSSDSSCSPSMAKAFMRPTGGTGAALRPPGEGAVSRESREEAPRESRPPRVGPRVCGLVPTVSQLSSTLPPRRPPRPPGDGRPLRPPPPRAWLRSPLCGLRPSFFLAFGVGTCVALSKPAASWTASMVVGLSTLVPMRDCQLAARRSIMSISMNRILDE